MNWIIVIIILLVIYCLYRRRINEINGMKEIDMYDIDVIQTFNPKNDVSRYTSFPDKPPSSTYMDENNKTVHKYPFDEYSLYGLDDIPTTMQ